MIDWLIDWGLTPILAIVQLYRGVSKENGQKDKQRSTKHYTEKLKFEHQRVNSCVQEGLAVPVPHDIRRVTVKQHEHHLIKDDSYGNK